MSDRKHLPPAYQGPGPFLSRSPMRYIWLATSLAILCLRVPLWSFIYLPASFRPNPEFTWKQAMMIRLLKWWHDFASQMRPQLTAPAEPGMLGGPAETFQLIEPAHSSILTGVLSADKTDVKPVQRPGAWYPAIYKPEEDDGKKVLLWCFGGAYVVGGHDTKMVSGMLDRLLPALGGAKLFSFGYRLASSEGNHFPTQMFDAVSAYQHLLGLGIKPGNIILIGESAGGHLCLTLLRYIADNPGVLPNPGAALLGSPWVDLTMDVKAMTKLWTYDRDIVTEALGEWGISTFVPSNKRLDDPYISPGLNPFRTKVPLWVDACSDEVLHDQIVNFVKGMQDVEGNDVDFDLFHNGTHAVLMFGQALGFERLADQRVALVKKFIEGRGL